MTTLHGQSAAGDRYQIQNLRSVSTEEGLVFVFFKIFKKSKNLMNLHFYLHKLIGAFKSQLKSSPTMASSEISVQKSTTGADDADNT